MGKTKQPIITQAAVYPPTGTLTVTSNGGYDVESYEYLITDIPTGKPISVTSSDVMDGYLLAGSDGESYLYNGTTDEKYTNGYLYIMREK